MQFVYIENILFLILQELLAYGTANIVSSFFSCFVSAASLARSVIQDKVGGKTQVRDYWSSPGGRGPQFFGG